MAGAGCSRTDRQPVPADGLTSHQACLQRAARYLWSRQADDGGWHSRTYGLLRSGQSLTPFVLNPLLQVPAALFEPPGDAVERAFAFLHQCTDARGAVGRMDPVALDYPNYATALAVLALCRPRAPHNARQAAAPLVACLRKQQFSEENGWQRRDAPYGAWGMGGERRSPPHPGHVDLSMTRHVLQALAASGVVSDAPAFEKARVFVERCQNYDPAAPDRLDGGFYFSTVVLDANKAGFDGTHYRSYGTATADGILALLAIGCSVRDERIQAARNWLTKQHRLDGVPGFAGEAYRRWPKGLYYYYAAVSTEAFRSLGVARYHHHRISNELQKAQRPDGSWANAEDLVKEDDPLIATGFAVRALVNEMNLPEPSEQPSSEPSRTGLYHARAGRVDVRVAPATAQARGIT